MTKSCLYVAGLHGDETAPVFALLSAGKPVLIGNPRALTLGRRFIDRDLNASFNSSGSSYEERRAGELLSLIPAEVAVLDFHTFSCESQPFAVVVREAELPLARATGVRHIVIMRHNIKGGHSLCDARRAVSVEVGPHASEMAFQETLRVVKCVENEVKTAGAVLYEVFDIIKEPGVYRNFEPCVDGFIPVLAGERAYSHFGLKARICKCMD